MVPEETPDQATDRATAEALGDGSQEQPLTELEQIQQHDALERARAEREGEEPMLKFFSFNHLPAKLRAQSARFCDLAVTLVRLAPRSAERTVALRKLLESKDAAVRALL